jgi:hypothetical protein
MSHKEKRERETNICRRRRKKARRKERGEGELVGAL